MTKSQEGMNPGVNPFIFAIPAVFDLIAQSLYKVALTMVSGSVYQMMRGMKIIITAFFTILFLKTKLFRHHWTSIAFIFIGLGLVGVAVLSDKSEHSITTDPLGMILLVFGTVFTAA